MKYKIPSQKNFTATKEGVIVIGLDQNTGNPILIPIKTVAYLDNNKTKAISKLYKKFKIPKRFKKFSALTPEEKRLISVVEGENASDNNSFVTIWDSTSDEYIVSQEELAKIEMLLRIITNFNLDYETEDGIMMWEDFGLVKDDYLALAYYLINEKGIDEGNIELILKEINLLKSNKQTFGEQYYNDMITKKEIKEELEKAKASIGDDSDEESEKGI